MDLDPEGGEGDAGKKHEQKKDKVFQIVIKH